MRRRSGSTVFSRVTTAGRATRLFRLRSYVFDPDLSHDGRRIAYADAQGHIWTIGVDGRHRVHVTNAAAISAPRWSGDDRRLAYDDGSLHTVAVAGGAIQDIDVGDDQPLAFAWSPHGAWLAVADEHDYDCGGIDPCSVADLWVVNVDTDAARRVHRGEPLISGLDWR